jgi:hypothetical protein
MLAHMPAQTRTRRMVAPVMFEVSGVDHPANNTQVGAEGWLVVKASTDTKEGHVAEGTEGTGADKATTTDADKIKALETKVEELTGELDAERKARKDAEDKAAKFDANTKKDEGESDPIAKALADDATPDVIKAALRSQADAMHKAQEQATKDRELLAKKLDDDATREFMVKAATYPHLATDPTTLGPVLKAAAGALDPAVFAELDRVLKSAEAASAEAEKILGQQIGANGTKVQPVMEKLRTLVVAKAAADPNLTPEAAEAAVWAEHPELIAEYRANEGA